MKASRMGAALLAAVGIVAGCTLGPAGTPTGATPVPLPPTAAGASATPGPSLPSQTATEWGRIWDALPPWFPIPDGAQPTETGAGPVTAELQLPANAGTAIDIARDFQSAFQQAGFATVNLDGPLEDGSVTVSVPGPEGACRIDVQVVPLGSAVVARVLYGAECPFE
jgi:hypothetical protein